MGTSYGDLYNSILFRLGFDPQNTGYRLGVRREFNDQLTEFVRMHPWRFLMRNDVLTLYGDYVTGTADFANGLNQVLGTGTVWTAAMEEAWIAPGTDPNPGQFVRIGRVGSGTALYLVDPYPNTTAAGSAYTIRFRYKRMPRDLLTLKGLGPGEDFNLDLEMITAEDAIARGYSEWIDTTGTVRYIIPATPPVWMYGSGIPRTPDVAPTLAASAAGTPSLIDGHTYEYRYTWVHHGTETGSSPTASITVATPNLTVVVSNVQNNTATDGRYARLYRRDKTNDTPWYRVQTQNGSASFTDDGTVTDYTQVYYDTDMDTWIRPWPRPSDNDSYPIQIRYHSRPREIQKDSDYPELPADAVTAIKTMTLIALGIKHNSPALVAQLRPELERQMKGLRSLYLSQTVGTLARRGIGMPGDRRIPAWLNRQITQT